MIQQKVLGFKIEKTEDTITPHGGLALLGEFMVGAKIKELADKHLPAPGSAKGYQPSEYIYPMILMLHGGGRKLEDLRVISQDEGLRAFLPLEKIPSSDATGDWLRRTGINGGLRGLEGVNQKLIKRGMKKDGIKNYTLDIDVTGIEAQKEAAKVTYKGYRGYMPMVGHLAENGLVVGDEFREGNEVPAAKNLEFVKYCRKQMPDGKRIKYLRAYSAAYQAEIINYCDEKGIEFAIGADLDQAVVRAIENIPQRAWKPYKHGCIAETVHSMNKTKKAFRLIVIRRPYQKNLFTQEGPGIKYSDSYKQGRIC